MPRAFFEQLTDALVGFLPPEHRRFSHYRTGHNVKVWFGDERREHYEAQLLSSKAVRATGRKTAGPGLEVGFHAEHKEADRNEAVIAALAAARDAWSERLGDAPEAGGFVGVDVPWRRFSEIWDGPGVTDPEGAIEAAERLADYIVALEPVRAAFRGNPSSTRP